MQRTLTWFTSEAAWMVLRPGEDWRETNTKSKSQVLWQTFSLKKKPQNFHVQVICVARNTGGTWRVRLTACLAGDEITEKKFYEK